MTCRSGLCCFRIPAIIANKNKIGNAKILNTNVPLIIMVTKLLSELSLEYQCLLGLSSIDNHDTIFTSSNIYEHRRMIKIMYSIPSRLLELTTHSFKIMTIFEIQLLFTFQNVYNI